MRAVCRGALGLGRHGNPPSTPQGGQAVPPGRAATHVHDARSARRHCPRAPANPARRPRAPWVESRRPGRPVRSVGACPSARNTRRSGRAGRRTPRRCHGSARRSGSAGTRQGPRRDDEGSRWKRRSRRTSGCSGLALTDHQAPGLGRDENGDRGEIRGLPVDAHCAHEVVGLRGGDWPCATCRAIGIASRPTRTSRRPRGLLAICVPRPKGSRRAG